MVTPDTEPAEQHAPRQRPLQVGRQEALQRPIAPPPGPVGEHSAAEQRDQPSRGRDGNRGPEPGRVETETSRQRRELNGPDTDMKPENAEQTRREQVGRAGSPRAGCLPPRRAGRPSAESPLHSIRAGQNIFTERVAPPHP
jgi:hypothetical protein